jgi:hypothetical protein
MIEKLRNKVLRRDSLLGYMNQQEKLAVAQNLHLNGKSIYCREEN